MFKRILLNLLGSLCGLLVFYFGSLALLAVPTRGFRGSSRSEPLSLLQSIGVGFLFALIAIASAVALRHIVLALRRDRAERTKEFQGFPVQPIAPDQPDRPNPLE